MPHRHRTDDGVTNTPVTMPVTAPRDIRQREYACTVLALLLEKEINAALFQISLCSRSRFRGGRPCVKASRITDKQISDVSPVVTSTVKRDTQGHRAPRAPDSDTSRVP